MFSTSDFIVLLATFAEAYCYENSSQINASVNGIKNEVLEHQTHFVRVSKVNLRKEISWNKKNTTRDRKVC